jgi:hypothetical protein
MILFVLFYTLSNRVRLVIVFTGDDFVNYGKRDPRYIAILRGERGGTLLMRVKQGSEEAPRGGALKPKISRYGRG